MKFKGKEIKILYVKFQHKETDGNRQEQTGTDRNQCIMKKFIHQIGNPEVRNIQEQTGTDRNRQELTEADRNRQAQTGIIAS